ncbi:hypothetical protein A6A08_11385 [Nocardiopsis sp. TSRI0078]|uniref:DUF2812 domain-containing protein n=1 Tax=unclassified Nocardiopsis TaxID=2649073 RepID=UPI00093F40FC|nr:DUF2812 domain-containing protein [Nocardiopsis sp. TSRI0078]OKI15122.1 hypothetical protein A6A08_11385 [Nocardiopsis sp. TSRI0078]
MNDYFTALAARLRERGVDGGRSRALLEELAEHTAASGSDPVEEFGPVEEFAAALTPSAEEESADGGEDVLVWSADAFEGPARLNEMGGQGWEVERVDRLGRFVSRRASERPQTWEYRQEFSHGRGDRERLAERLAPEGWEPCGHWSVLAYFKRPGSVTSGPAAELDSPPVPGRRRYFLGARGALAIGASLLVAVGALGWSLLRLAEAPAKTGSAADWAGYVTGAVTGALVVLGLAWGAARLAAVRRDRARD